MPTQDKEVKTPEQAPKDQAPKPKETAKPSQPTVHAKGPTTPSNDPITNEAERKLAEEELGGTDQTEADLKAQEEEIREQQRLADQRRTLMQDLVKSPEGFVVLDQSNSEVLEDARVQGLVYHTNVQAGRGGLEVEERYFLADKGYQSLRSVFGEDLGVKQQK